MAITNYLVHFKTKANYETTTATNPLRNDAVAFIKDATIIRTHGTDYYCGSGPVALKTDLRTPLVLDLGEGLESSGTLTGIDYAELTDAIANGRQILVKSSDNLISPTAITNLGSSCTITFDSYPQSFTLTISSNLQYVSETTLIQTTLTQLGITATATELNYVDGVTSNIQTQLNGKAASSHTHSIANVSGLQDALDEKQAAGSYAAASHNHTSANVTALTGYVEGSSTTTLTATMSLNTALASLQNQIQTKQAAGNYAAASHTHSASDITSGTLALARIPTGTSSTTVALGNHTHSEYAASSHTHTASQVSGLATVATSGSYNDLSNKPSIPEAYTLPTASASTLGGVKIGSGVSISNGVISVSTTSIGAASSSDLNNYLSLSGGTLTFDSGGSITFGSSSGTPMIVLKSSSNYYRIQATSDAMTFTPQSGYSMQYTGSNKQLSLGGDVVLTEANYSDYISVGGINSTNSSSKLFLIGGTTQSSDPSTYSNSSVYTQSGQLYATQMNATNGFYETSDARLKNFGEDVKALEIASEIPTKYFAWKSDEKQELHIGTSAQEIQKIYPDLVSENEDGHLTVDYARLSIIALAAIKELKAEVDELKSNE